MAATRRKRKSKKCQSCRKLKISCDLVKPVCEYCMATRRKCVYDTDEPEAAHPVKFVEGEDINSISTSASSSDTQLVSVGSLLNDLDDVGSGIEHDGSDKTDLVVSDLIPYRELYVFTGNSPDSKFPISNDCSKDNDSPESPIMDLFPITSNSYVSLNSMSSHLQISKFEYYLLKFFNNYYLDKTMLFKQFSLKFLLQIPYLWHKSSILRDNVYCLSCMYLYCLSSIKDETAIKSIVTDQKLVIYRNSLIEETGNSNVDSELYYKCFEYFDRCLKQSQKQIEQWQHTMHETEDLDEAANIIVSGVLLYLFLIVQPFDAVPVLSDKGDPYLVGICRGMRKHLGSQFSHIEGTRYDNLMSFKDCKPNGVLFSGFPMINLLYQDLLKLKATEEINQTVFAVHLESLLVFDRSFLKAVESSSWSGIFRWLFLLDDEAYDLMSEREFFSARLLFVYCGSFYFAGLKCLSVPMEYYALNQYAHWYKDFNHSKYGKWRYKMDLDIYTLMMDFNYTFPLHNVDYLFSFTPSKELDNFKTACTE